MISHELATSKAEEEYETYHVKRIAETDKKDSDFDKAIKKLDTVKKQFKGRKPRKGKSDDKKN
ncbi:hypothetical protein ACFL50_00150 [Candidatus Latescibacterota bacterium]